MKGLFFHIYILYIVLFLYTESFSLKSDISLKKKDFEFFLKKIENQMLDQVKVSIERSRKQFQIEKEKCNLSRKVLICIDKEPILKSTFEEEYNFFKKITQSNISQERYVNKFIQNKSILDKINKKIDKKILNFLVKSALSERYLSELKEKIIKSILKKDILNFYKKKLSKIKTYEKFSMKKNFTKIKEIYQNQIILQKQQSLFLTLKGKYKIFQNDEWKNNLIHKFIQKKYSKKEKKRDIYN